MRTFLFMETLFLSLFAVILTVFIAFDLSIVLALTVGLFIFSVYAKLKGYNLKEIVKMIIDGAKTSKNILVVFFLIGILTALWRDCGTIPAIISYTVGFINPKSFILMTFLLCCLVSFLIGTSFGSAATMGVICMTMGAAMGANPVLSGGAMLSGVLFGDRCSPVSTSALLVSELTGTSIYENIKRMFTSAAVPFAITCAVYFVSGLFSECKPSTTDVAALFSKEFTITPSALIPAAVIIILSLFRVKTKISMLISIISAFFVSIFIQKTEFLALIECAINGYKATDSDLSQMLDGGGIVSMVRVLLIVCISSAYSGIFNETGMLVTLKEKLIQLAEKTNSFTVMIIVSVITSMISCNQTLAIILTENLCDKLTDNKKIRAIDLENSVVVIAPLIPWSIAGAVPLASAGAPTKSLFAACFLYLLPLWTLVTKITHKTSN
ncbi:MAG: sodium:proton antiporter [Ruminococcaceae bacterium]|nr:sodium:proton antiporter [Oscillospiraceae bacterium]